MSRSPSPVSCDRLQEAEPEGREYDHVVATRDHHVDPGAHFSADPDFVDSWPPHCVAGTVGAAFHPNLDPQPLRRRLRQGRVCGRVLGIRGPDRTTASRWPTGCASTRCHRSTSWASPPTTACAPRRWTRRARASRPECCFRPDRRCRASHHRGRAQAASRRRSRAGGRSRPAFLIRGAPRIMFECSANRARSGSSDAGCGGPATEKVEEQWLSGCC